MTLDGIEVFVGVVQAGSFSQAARMMNMPVTTVSGKISALEKRLGITLIHRTTRKLHISEAGEAYFKRCVHALEEVKAGESEIRTRTQKPKGLLRITATSDVGHTLLPRLVRAYLRKFPETQVEIVIRNSQVDLISEGIDLAIQGGELKDSSLIAKRFFEAKLSLWATSAYLASAGTPKHPKDLKDHRVLVHSRFTSRALNLTGTSKGNVKAKLSSRVSADDLETIKSLVLLGEGIGLIPSFLCEQEARTGKLVQVLPSFSQASTVFSFVYPAQRYVSPKIRGFIAVAEELQAR